MYMKIEVPSVTTLAVKGPVQCGKSYVMWRIKQLLDELGATVVLNDELQQDFNGTDYEKGDYGADLIKGSVWVLAE